MSRIPLWVWFVLPTIIIIIVGALVATKITNKPAQEDPNKPESVSVEIEGLQEFDTVGSQHIDEGTTVATYNSNPPTSGNHWPTPANKGIYDKSLPDERLVHNLEHGYIWISYKSDISQESLNQLKEIVQKDDWKIVLEPREANDSQIVLSAWGRLLKLESLDQEKIETFIKAFRNRGPEKTPD